MQHQEIEITIRPDGKIEYTIKGIKGNACTSISELLEQLGQVEESANTGEYYEYGSDAHIHVGAS
ncbi:MAG TPA: DUF2997 domain-containing protein [Caldilineaceae bacterium]|nr:DUF2997 domain-containing protein [Caldilineaceae bacterium]